MKLKYTAVVILVAILSLAISTQSGAAPYHKHHNSWYRWHSDICAKSPVHGRLEPCFRERCYSNYSRHRHYYYGGYYRYGRYHGKYRHSSPAILSRR